MSIQYEIHPCPDPAQEISIILRLQNKAYMGSELAETCISPLHKGEHILTKSSLTASLLKLLLFL